MLKELMGKGDNMQYQMDNVSREIEILRKNKKEILKIKKHYNRNEDYLMGPSVDWTRLRK